jgi:AcrR family transcriptional regulator
MFGMTVKGSAGLSQAERSAESSQRLLAAAIALIAEKGFEKTTAAEIGERAGYSRAMVRSRYGTKEALLESLMRSEYEPMFLVTPAMAVDGLATILGHLDHLAVQAAQNPELLRAFFTVCFETVGPIQRLSPWLRAWLARYRAATNAAFIRGQKDGSIRLDLDIDAENKKIISHGIGLGFRWTLEPDDVDFVAELRQWRAALQAQYEIPSAAGTSTATA